MSTKANTQQESTDPRDDYIHIGIDTHDASHVYRTKDETVLVIEDGEITHKIDLIRRRKSVNDWIEHVKITRGFEEQHLFKSMADFAGSRVNL
jgi:hypothetical protein